MPGTDWALRLDVECQRLWERFWTNRKQGTAETSQEILLVVPGESEKTSVPSAGALLPGEAVQTLLFGQQQEWAAHKCLLIKLL